MKRKVLIEPQFKRRIPEHFTWVDHRLVRDGHIRKCSIRALGFYLFLLSVSDSEGLSYYGEKRIAEELGIPEDSISSLRQELIKARLIAYSQGIYQLLDLQEVKYAASKSQFTGVCKASDVLSALIGEMKNG